jgi:hypothetical protein
LAPPIRARRRSPTCATSPRAPRLHHGSLRADGSHRVPLAALRDALDAALPAATWVTGDASPLGVAVTRLRLSPGEATLTALAAGYDLDLDLRELLHALAPRRRPALWLEAIADVGRALGPRFALTTPADAHRAVDGAALRRTRLLDLDGTGLGATIQPSATLRGWLLDGDAWPAATNEVAAVLAPTTPSSVHLPDAVTAGLDRLLPCLRPTAAPVLVTLRGARGSGRRAAAHRLARGLARPLLVIDGRRLARQPSAVEPTLARLLTDAELRDALVLVLDAEQLHGDAGQLPVAVERRLAAHPAHLLLATPSAGAPDLGRDTHEVSLGRATLDDREAAWRAALAAAPHHPVVLDAWARELAARYVLGPGAAADVAAAATRAAAAAGTPLALAHLDAAASSRLSLRLGAYGTVVSRKARFEELVLPDDTVDVLRDMVAMVASRSQILERWQLGRHLGIARGVSALFSGDPGTGKTMAASVLASALGLELVRIDLATVVSKYVGETEKNLAAIFDEAQDAHAMLLFDEADGLFGKRTEVKSAQDRFANLEVGYLLQRIEQFDGVSILTTNLEASIDAALLRRLSFRVRFPAPEPAERERLWRQLLPPAAFAGDRAPLAGLAEAFAMSGGYIKNAIVRAAVIAARADRALALDDLWTAAHAEYAEMGKVTTSLHRPA